jgi:hypothetical protein
VAGEVVGEFFAAGFCRRSARVPNPAATNKAKMHPASKSLLLRPLTGLKTGAGTVVFPLATVANDLAGTAEPEADAGIIGE